VSFALKKKAILRDRKAIRALFERGSWKSCPFFHMVYFPNTGDKRYLFATRKTIRGAVPRNRSRRVLKEAVRLNQDTIPLGYDYGFIATVVPEKGERPLIEKYLKKMVTQIT
jgi:ribonuclease P protein component